MSAFPSPTLDRPYGIHLWPYFDRAFELVTGSPAHDFRFRPGSTPLSTSAEAFGVIVIYYAVIYGGRELMRSREPFRLKALFLVHNLVLSIVSGILLLLFMEQMIPSLVRNGLFYSICDRNGGYTQPMVVLYYINYLIKFYELLDTVFLFFKKKPLTFLHCYHHGATALLCGTQIIGQTAVSWVPICINLLVHVVMYWYYFQCARGLRVWWKEWVTRMQIAQFVIDLGFIYFACYTYFTSIYINWLPTYGVCAGEEYAAIAGTAIISSYLVLFISFYLATYRRDGKASSGRKAVRRMSQAPLPDPKLIISSMTSAVPGSGTSSADFKAKGSVTGRTRRA